MAQQQQQREIATPAEDWVDDGTHTMRMKFGGGENTKVEQFALILNQL